MKILHTADLHLGKLYKGESFKRARQRREELWESFSNLINYANSNNIEIILISGDLYERESFTLSDFKRLGDLFLHSNSQIYIIGGNHDHIDGESLFLKMDFPKKVHIFEDKNYFEYKDVRVYGISWDRQFDFNAEIDFNLDRSFKNILMLHCSVGFESHFPIKEDTLNNLDFDYIALGHLHGHNKVADKAYYSGALEPLRFKDVGEHGFYVYDLNNKNQEFIKSAKREYNIIEYDLTNKSYNQIKDELERILIQKRDDFNRLILKGITDDIESVKDLLNVDLYYLIVVDETNPLLDYNVLAKDDETGIIAKFLEIAEDEEIKKYGIEALLETANEDKRA